MNINNLAYSVIGLSFGVFCFGVSAGIGICMLLDRYHGIGEFKPNEESSSNE